MILTILFTIVTLYFMSVTVGLGITYPYHIADSSDSYEFEAFTLYMGSYPILSGLFGLLALILFIYPKDGLKCIFGLILTSMSMAILSILMSAALKRMNNCIDTTVSHSCKLVLEKWTITPELMALYVVAVEIIGFITIVLLILNVCKNDKTDELSLVINEDPDDSIESDTSVLLTQTQAQPLEPIYR